MTEPKLKVSELKRYFYNDPGFLNKTFGGKKVEAIKAVDGVSFEMAPGDTLGIAGESGCGKTTLGKTILHLQEPTGGDVYFDGQNITELSSKELKEFRKDAQIIIQDPYESLNPRFKVKDWVIEPLKVHNLYSGAEREDKVAEMLATVDLNPESYQNELISELSGGERQRVAIARSLITNPSFLVADEPASMLDASIRAKVLSLLEDIQAERDLTAVYISHDLSLLSQMCERLAIMYLGKIVEIGSAEEIINSPKHPYTKELVNSVPRIKRADEREPLQIHGGVPDPTDIGDHCRFSDRCPESWDRCFEEVPEMYNVSGTQYAKCFLYDDEE